MRRDTGCRPSHSELRSPALQLPHLGLLQLLAGQLGLLLALNFLLLLLLQELGVQQDLLLQCVFVNGQLLIGGHVLLQVTQILVPLLLHTLSLLALQLHLREDPGCEGRWWLASTLSPQLEEVGPRPVPKAGTEGRSCLPRPLASSLQGLSDCLPCPELHAAFPEPHTSQHPASYFNFGPQTCGKTEHAWLSFSPRYL